MLPAAFVPTAEVFISSHQGAIALFGVEVVYKVVFAAVVGVVTLVVENIAHPFEQTAKKLDVVYVVPA
jgi:hypothetical protein